ncbi:MAG: glycoside hydrolase family 3 C-terminal domain-containing protein [Clostridiales Family XIII bacterium]|jgi:beta-glucosidase|nr:glycoside hydrolase family 3 C-terminal domain-containing protein [Clostridiales Family XIII bacterium]
MMERYKDTALAARERADDLLSRMTLDERVAQLQCTMVIGEPEEAAKGFPHGIGSAVAFSVAQDPAGVAENNRKVAVAFGNGRLGIPPLIHIEAVTGVVSPGGTTFPSAIGLGATFSPDTIRDMADTIRVQMLAIGYRHALSPVMDVSRDPRWGRIGETYGEDPALCAAMSVAYTKGLQGETLNGGAVATGKHFLGYGLSDGGLNMATNPIPERELREVYAKPFQAAITEAGLRGVMNSYGSIDGEMIIGSKKILTDLLRGEMGFGGILVSDYMSIERLVNYRLLPDPDSAGVAALQAGLDAEYPLTRGYGPNLTDAVNRGELDIADIDRSVRRMLTVKFELGLFDVDDASPNADALADAYGDPIHIERSLKAARESVVLLKNDGVLPLSNELKTLAVIGPHADSLRLLFGCYTLPAGMEMQMSNSMADDMAGLDGMDEFASSLDGAEGQANENAKEPSPPETYPNSDVLREREDVRAMLQMVLGAFTPTILSSIREKCPKTDVVYAKGCDIAGDDDSGFAEAVSAAKNADAVVMTLGGKYGWGANCTIGEGLDRDDIGLTGIQEELAKAVIGTGTPCVVVHMDARPLSSEYIKGHASALIENWFPGSTGGQAIADVLFGDYNPAGRMPVTAARNAGQIPVYSGQKTGNSYYAKTTVGALSRYVESSTEPLFYFGEGLSYTMFAYENLSVTPQASAGGAACISFEVTNTGERDGEEVAQLYVSDECASMLRPAKEFAGCKRVFLKAGEKAGVKFTVRADQFAFLDRDMNWLVEKGKMNIMVGASSEDIRLTGGFEISETKIVDGRSRGFYASAEVTR